MELETESRAHLTRNGNAPVTVSRYADVRFAGQAYELPVPVPDGEVDVARLVADFVAEHDRTYGHGSADDPVDVVSVRALARLETHRGAALRPTRGDPGRCPPLEGSRPAYFGPETGLVDTPVCNRAGPPRRPPQRAAARRRARLHVRRPAGMGRAPRRPRQPRGGARCADARPDHARGREERARVDGGRDGAGHHAERVLAGRPRHAGLLDRALRSQRPDRRPGPDARRAARHLPDRDAPRARGARRRRHSRATCTSPTTRTAAAASTFPTST